jgi:hypothetical protein
MAPRLWTNRDVFASGKYQLGQSRLADVPQPLDDRRVDQPTAQGSCSQIAVHWSRPTIGLPKVEAIIGGTYPRTSSTT